VSPTFRSLAIPNYRLWATGAIVSNTGTWMQRVAQDWLVLTVLTRDSGVAVGITTGLQFAPMLLLAPVAGTIADRFDRRRVLLATQTASGLLALLLGLLVVTDVARLWHVYALAFGLGVAAAVDGPARQAFVSELVPLADLPNAVGLNSASFHAGRLIGPGIAGLLIGWLGTGPVFWINAATFGAVVLSLRRMRIGDLTPAPRAARGRGAVREGLRYVRSRPDLMLILVIVGLVGTFGLNFGLTTALMARLVFDKGSGEYGLLGSIMAIGSLAGALIAARRPNPRLRLVVGATIAFGACSVVAALMPTYVLFAVALVPVGLAALTLMTAANAAVQVSTPPAMRGRVMALYMAVFMGGTPIGSPLIGWVGQQYGARWTILLGGGVALVTALGAVTWLGVVRGWRPGRSQPERVGEQLVADERDDVQQGVRDDQRQHPAPAQEPQREHDAHGRVAEERPEALVEVVGAAQHGAAADHRPQHPAALPEPGQQVPDDDDLLQDGVLQRRQDQYRHRPPVRRQAGRHDLGGDPELAAGGVQGEPGQPDGGREHRALEQVTQRLPEVQAEQPDGRPAARGEQPQRQGHRDDPEDDVGELVGEVEVGPRAA
jgi:MFS family permease